MNSLYTHITGVAENIVWVAYTHSQEPPKKSILIAEDFEPVSDINTGRNSYSHWTLTVAYPLRK